MDSTQFDPKLPLDYKKLGGETPEPTPTQYSWLTTLLIRLYHTTPLSTLITFLHTRLGPALSTILSTLTHLPFRLWSLIPIPPYIRSFPSSHLWPNFKHILEKAFTTPQYLSYKYPITTTFFFSILFSYLVLYDYETDLKHTPFFPIHDPKTPLGQALSNGRKIRRLLGGSTFTDYQQKKLNLGESTPTKQLFVEYFGPFVDELEWNHHYNYKDDHQDHVLYSSHLPLTEADLELQIKHLRSKQRLELLDERFRQEELLASRRIIVKDEIYNQTKWDLRDGSIIPPGQEPDPSFKQYLLPKPNPDNPIPHEPGHGSLGNTGVLYDKTPYWDPLLEDYAKLNTTGEFTYELTDLYNNDYKPKLTKGMIKPHRNPRIVEDGNDPINQSILRVINGQDEYLGEEEALLSRITRHQKKQLLGVHDGDGKHDGAGKYNRKQHMLLKEQMQRRKKPYIGKKRPGVQYDDEFDDSDGDGDGDDDDDDDEELEYD